MINLVRKTFSVVALILSLAALHNSRSEAAQLKVEVVGYSEKTIYHSPETPGYTAWVGLAQMPDGTLRCDFVQLTGPKDHPVATVPVLRSSDEGESWTLVSRGVSEGAWAGITMMFFDPATGMITGSIAAPENNRPNAGIITARPRLSILSDGTMFRPAWTLDPGYLQRSTDGGRTWGKPVYLMPPGEYRTWPTIIRRLRDGRLVLMAGCAKRIYGKRMGQMMTKMMFISSDKGKSWSKPITLMPAEQGVCEESDFCELPNGDLFWVHRAEHYPEHKTDWYSDRMQSITRKKGDTFVPEPAVRAPFRHSGFPAVLYAREGLILHLATDGIYWSADVGKNWTRLPIPGTKYYPQAIQSRDGKILCVGHIGGDNLYGSVDQAVVLQTFRLELKK